MLRHLTTITITSALATTFLFSGYDIEGFKRVTLNKLGTYDSGKKGGSEISAFDSKTKRLFITNGADNKLDIVSISDVTAPAHESSIDLSLYGDSVQSVTTKKDKVAVAVGSSDKTGEVGKVVIFGTDGNFISQTKVGFLPDMVTFTDDGKKVLVANEGEPDGATGAYVDVKGSIGIVTVSKTTVSDDAAGYAEVDFSAATLKNANDGTQVRLGGTPSNSKSLDIEPEYIAINGNTAYVTLQENNAVAKVDFSRETPILTWVKSLGSKDYTPGNALNNTIDIIEEGTINMSTYAGLHSLYMPDTIASYSIKGQKYFVTANEGDGREYLDSNDNNVFVDEIKIKKLVLDSTIANSYANGEGNDLKVMKDMGKNPTTKLYEKLYTYGGRSFSIFDDNGDLVYDSGNIISKMIAQIEPALFNIDKDTMDGRSGNKGSEPEALALAKISNQTFAFVGLERQSAIMIFNITNPSDVQYVDYVITREAGNPTAGDIAPEGMFFIPAGKSPNEKDILVVSSEVSGTTSIFEIVKITE
jgi:5'-nucleotidase